MRSDSALKCIQSKYVVHTLVATCEIRLMVHCLIKGVMLSLIEKNVGFTLTVESQGTLLGRASGFLRCYQKN